MSYEEAYAAARDDAQLLELDGAISAYIEQYKKSPALPADRQTVILFPGGSGSELKRSPCKYQEGDSPDPKEFECVWFDCLTLLGNALLLRMKRVKDVYMEFDHHIIVAGGPVQFLNQTPYDEFIRWCNPRGIDPFIYGYDWRRAFADCARFFVTRFLPYFRGRVMGACGAAADPLKKMSLVGHSQGGILVNWILRKHYKEIEQIGGTTLHRLVTVATPFYGYAGQIDRWFSGMPLLNLLGKNKLVKVISSLPALYTLNFLDEQTYLDNRELLEKDAYRLADYPSKDHDTPSQCADPYNPGAYGELVRYPSQEITGFCPAELKRGGDVFRFLAKPIDDPCLSARFFNIRGVRRRDSTTGSTRWDWIQQEFDPEKKTTPIEMGDDVPGDGTQPAWTARLLRQDESERSVNIITVKIVSVEHVFILYSSDVLRKLADVLGVPAMVKTKTTKPSKRLPRAASSQQAFAFVRDLQKKFVVPENDRVVVTKADVRRYLKTKGLSLTMLKPIARRILIDLVRPLPSSYPGGGPKAPSGGEPPSSKPAAIIRTATKNASGRAASDRTIVAGKRRPRRLRVTTRKTN